MNISFSTSCKFTAKKYLDDDKYNYFNAKAKTYILENVSEHFRVQDPFMYPSPQIEIIGHDQNESKAKYDALISLALGREAIK